MPKNLNASLCDIAETSDTARASLANRLTKVLAAAAAPAAVSSSVEAADFFNSGPITMNNTVGWSSNSPQLLSSYPITLKNGTAELLGIAYGNPFYAAGTAFIRLETNAQGLDFMAGISSYYLKAFPALAKWTAVGSARNNTLWGLLRVSTNYVTGVGTLFYRTALGNTSVSDEYLLFKFTDNAEDYFGWILVDGETRWDGPNVDVNLTVKGYAWQKGSFGIIEAGATAVPEPSTLVTSGIAALAGGAVALRRWRRERKTEAPAA